ncbi:hypothetical protein OF83DRAFT_144004 [Amylostereum chailletii]|nr:hypothetical protein OF83DRAFT_144004 [Amylostereum chailletii]
MSARKLSSSEAPARNGKKGAEKAGKRAHGEMGRGFEEEVRARVAEERTTLLQEKQAVLEGVQDRHDDLVRPSPSLLGGELTTCVRAGARGLSFGKVHLVGGIQSRGTSPSTKYHSHLAHSDGRRRKRTTRMCFSRCVLSGEGLSCASLLTRVADSTKWDMISSEIPQPSLVLACVPRAALCRVASSLSRAHRARGHHRRPLPHRPRRRPRTIPYGPSSHLPKARAKKRHPRARWP